MTTAAAELLADLTKLGVEVAAHGDRLRYRPRAAVTRQLAERLTMHKPGLLAILRPAGACEGRSVEHDGATHAAPTAAGDSAGWDDLIDPPAPCADCGGLRFWWNMWGDARCMDCDPPTTAIRLLERAQRIRRRHGIPTLAGADEMLAEMKRLTGG